MWVASFQFNAVTGAVLSRRARTTPRRTFRPAQPSLPPAPVPCARPPARLHTFVRTRPQVIAIIVVGCVALLAMVAAVVYSKSQARPAVVQYMLDVRKRVMGEPIGGPVTVVVTGGCG